VKKLMGNAKDCWWVYIVRCSDGTLYTGITNNLARRIKSHNSGKDAARYTRARRPVELVYSEQVGSRSAAARLEYQLKKMKHTAKNRLIRPAG
jgi:putative endonuclease